VYTLIISVLLTEAALRVQWTAVERAVCSAALASTSHNLYILLSTCAISHPLSLNQSVTVWLQLSQTQSQIIAM